jgi:CubicO group peptidase (beta-lactamase class C family)
MRTTALLLGAAVSAACAGPAPLTVEERVDALVTQRVQSTGPGCAVGIGRAGEVLYAQGYGIANLDHQVAITPDTVFDVGSVTK